MPFHTTSSKKSSGFTTVSSSAKPAGGSAANVGSTHAGRAPKKARTQAAGVNESAFAGMGQVLLGESGNPGDNPLSGVESGSNFKN